MRKILSIWQNHFLLVVALFLAGAHSAFAQSLSLRRATATSINGPTSLALYRDRYLYIADEGGSQPEILRLDLKKQTIKRIAGNRQDCCFREGAPATKVSFFWINSIAVDSSGDVFVADDHRVLKIDARSGA